MNLTVKLSPPEMKEFSTAVTVLYKYAGEVLPAKDYFHYYNIQALWKRLFDKTFKGFTRTPSVKVNVNEFESIKYIVNYVSEPDSNLFYDYTASYHGILLQKVIGILDKQRITLVDFRQSSLLLK